MSKKCSVKFSKSALIIFITRHFLQSDKMLDKIEVFYHQFRIFMGQYFGRSCLRADQDCTHFWKKISFCPKTYPILNSFGSRMCFHFCYNLDKNWKNLYFRPKICPFHFCSNFWPIIKKANVLQIFFFDRKLPGHFWTIRLQCHFFTWALDQL